LEGDEQEVLAPLLVERVNAAVYPITEEGNKEEKLDGDGQVGEALGTQATMD